MIGMGISPTKLVTMAPKADDDSHGHVTTFPRVASQTLSASLSPWPCRRLSESVVMVVTNAMSFLDTSR
jgi:hypothetical protein